MSYIVRVVGYNAFYTNDHTPGKLWATNLQEAFQFDSLEEATKIVESGQNMEAVEYADALDSPGNAIPDWNRIDQETERLESEKKAGNEALKKVEEFKQSEEYQQYLKDNEPAIPVDVQVL